MLKKSQKATFGAGCFWGVENAFRKVDGVIDAVSGYMGGHTDNPTYEEVCTDQTGHVEVVQVEYDPQKATYESLLDKFWEIHDPTQLNRQGPDVGTQYRSAIFYHDKEQKKLAEESIKELKYDKPVMTEITKASQFYKAEEYHQRYLEKNNLKICH